MRWGGISWPILGAVILDQISLKAREIIMRFSEIYISEAMGFSIKCEESFSVDLGSNDIQKFAALQKLNFAICLTNFSSNKTGTLHFYV